MRPIRTFRVQGPGDLLAVVPLLLGFHPEDSVVLLSLGERPFAARLDLPAVRDDLPLALADVSVVARRNGMTRAALVVYSDDEAAALAACDAAVDALEAAGAEVVEAVRADGSRWFTLTGCNGPCCPAEGTRYDISSHPLTAQAVLDGQVTLGSRRELESSLTGTDLAAIEAVGEAADEALDRFRLTGSGPLDAGRFAAARAHLVQEGHWVAERVRRFLRDAEPLDDTEVGRLVVAIVAIEVRDVAWAEMDRGNADRHVDLWRDVVRRTPHDLLAAPAALLAFAAWLSGDGALAWCAVERCREAEPDYSLAGLIGHALAGGVPPSTWRPLGPDALTLFAG